MKAAEGVMFLVGVALALCLGPLEATTIGPDAFGYTATDQVQYAFEDISSTGTRIFAGADDVFTLTPPSLGFTFNVYGTDYTQAYMSDNGFLTFGAGRADYLNRDITTTSVLANRPAIAPLWDDWFFNTSARDDAVYYQTSGTAGNRRFIVQWNEAQPIFRDPDDADNTVTFQAMLFEGSNEILFQYLDVDTHPWFSSGRTATVGIRDTDGHLNGEALQWSYDSEVIDPQMAILFSPGGALPGAIPEPTTMALLGIAGLALAAWRRRELFT